MGLILLIIVVLVLLALVIWTIRATPVATPFNWLLQALCVVLAILFIGRRAGFF